MDAVTISLTLRLPGHSCPDRSEPGTLGETLATWWPQIVAWNVDREHQPLGPVLPELVAAAAFERLVLDRIV